jgi:O-antigen ligase
MADVANASFIGRAFDRARLATLADWLAAAVAVALPWSTTASETFIIFWLLALLPTLSFADLRRELSSAAGGLPALLWLAGALGMLWAHVSWYERFAGLGGFHKLLVIPLLLAQFRRSGRGASVLYGFVISCTVLLIASWTLRIIWDLWGGAGFYIRGKLPGIPVRDYIAQSTEFDVCMVGLAAACYEMARMRRVGLAVLLGALAFLFLANVLYVSPSRSALVMIPFLIALWGVRHFGWKGFAGAALAAVVVAGIAWAASPFLRYRLLASIEEVQSYRSENAKTSAGLRLEFWKKSVGFVAEAPLFGNGTGTIPDLFRRAAKGESGAESVASVNPHNQYLAIAIQLGLVGVAILIGMWVAHFALFHGSGLVPWLGLAMVLQNVVASAFNSHLFDSFHGWLYVFGVGVLGGMVLHHKQDASGETA